MNNETDNMTYARINITLPKDILEKVEKQRIKENRNLSNMIVCMMEFYIENKDKVKWKNKKEELFLLILRY